MTHLSLCAHKGRISRSGGGWTLRWTHNNGKIIGGGGKTEGCKNRLEIKEMKKNGWSIKISKKRSSLRERVCVWKVTVMWRDVMSVFSVYNNWRETEKWNFQHRVYCFFNYIKSMSLGVRMTWKSLLKTIGWFSWNAKERPTVKFVCLCYSDFILGVTQHLGLHVVRMPPWNLLRPCWSMRNIGKETECV